MRIREYHVSLTVRISESRREEHLGLPRKSFREAVLQDRCEVASKNLIQPRNGLSIHRLSFILSLIQVVMDLR